MTKAAHLQPTAPRRAAATREGAIGDGSVMPKISCITTFFKEGELIRQSIESILSQSYENLELLLISDGADDSTRLIAESYSDERIRHIRQANDGLSSARNRGLGLAQGEYVCFLDGDDRRPPWALQLLADYFEKSVDVVLCKGVLAELRGEVRDFYDSEWMECARAVCGGSELVSANHPRFDEVVGYALLCEPQSANKVVRREFLSERSLRFPPGLFFEDMLFHMAAVCSARSFAFSRVPSFVYFRRYGRPQITATSGTLRFDAVSVAGIVFETFTTTRYFHKPFVRACLVFSMFKLLRWCEESISHAYRYHYRCAVTGMWSRVHPLLRSALQTPEASKVKSQASWGAVVDAYVRSLSR